MPPAAIPSPLIGDAQTAPDPIFAAIEAHRAANAEFTKANDAADLRGAPRRARVFLGYKLKATRTRTKTSLTISSEEIDEQEPGLRVLR